MVNAITVYINADEALEAKIKEMDRVFAPVISFASMASGRQYDRIIFSGVSIPLTSADLQSMPIDRIEWPDIEKIVSLLNEYHDLRHQTLTAWNRMSAKQQSRLKPPENL